VHVETIGSGPRVVLVHRSGVSTQSARRSPRAGHSVPRAPGFDERLRDFLDRAETGVATY
jgi:hypothetical protein